MKRSFWERAASWCERWLQPLAFATSAYASTENAGSTPDLDDQLADILACVRQEELKWKVRDRIRNISRRPYGS